MQQSKYCSAKCCVIVLVLYSVSRVVVAKERTTHTFKQLSRSRLSHSLIVLINIIQVQEGIYVIFGTTCWDNDFRILNTQKPFKYYSFYFILSFLTFFRHDDVIRCIRYYMWNIRTTTENILTPRCQVSRTPGISGLLYALNVFIYKYEDYIPRKVEYLEIEWIQLR